MTDEEYVAEEQGRPVRCCALCDSVPVDWKCANHGVMLCYGCIQEIANVYAYEYFTPGKWLTYENKTEDDGRYKKAKIKRELRKKVFERDAYRCRHCGSWIDLSVDHIKPEVLGGTLDMENLQTLCRSCNSKKGTKY